MKRSAVLLIPLLLGVVHIPATTAHDSWIHITEPEPGLYFNGEKVVPLNNIVITIGGSALHIEATGSSNIVTVYFTMYNTLKKNMTESCWDTNGMDGWQCVFTPSRGMYVLGAAGLAIDIDEPVALDWLTIVSL